MGDIEQEEGYVWMPGQAYDPIRGLNRNARPVTAGQAPRCSCGKPRFLAKSGYLNTCLSQDCLEKFLGTKGREKKKGVKVPKIKPSPELARDLPRLLARSEP